jgi:hypothetical protein
MTTRFTEAALRAAYATRPVPPPMGVIQLA